jgi:pimeloyl-ACP methyl ester carboxylesterase
VLGAAWVTLSQMSRHTPLVLPVALPVAMALVALWQAPVHAGPSAPPSLRKTQHVYGEALKTVHVTGPELDKDIEFSKLATTVLKPGAYVVHARAEGEAVEFPPCNVRGRATVDGKSVALPEFGPAVSKLPGAGAHDMTFEVKVSNYENRIACGYAPRFGTASESRDDWQFLQFDSPNKGNCRSPGCTPGTAALYIPRGHDLTKPSAVLLGLHPWNGQAWTYAAYQELMQTAQDRDVVVLLPSGLGNSLYTAPAEDEAMRSLAALESLLAIDPLRVTIFGASMGGAGATTVGLHHPDRFSHIVSFFGDAKYDLTTYVRGLLPTEADAHRVNPLDVIENARNVPVWLIHGDADKVSSVNQSQMLYAALSERQYKVRFDKEPGRGHEGSLVTKYLRTIVELTALAKAPASQTRVSYKSVRKEDLGAYGVKLVRAGEGDALFDVEAVNGKLQVHAIANAKELVLRKGALGFSALPEVIFDGALKATPIRMEP